MELSEENLNTLSGYLRHTLNPDVNVRKPAEKFLESVEINQNYPILLLHLVDKQEVDLTVRIAGAVAFKNYIKRNWGIDEDGVDHIHAQDREAVKSLIVNLMLHSPEAVQKQLSDAVSIIGRHDFPAKWPNLISQMVEKFGTGDFHVINGVLHTAHSLFKRYRHEFKSQELWTEIKFVLDNFAKPLTELFQALMNFASTNANNPEALKVIYNSLVVICKVFYSLNCQDLPEFFEDNMNVWMPHFHTLLIADVKCLQTDDDEEPGLLEKLKAQVCENVAMYAHKYDEEFQPFLPGFVTDIWNLLTSTGQQPKYDLLVSTALQFLATVAERAQYRHLFADPMVLSSICQKVVIPNMEFRVSDEEMFEDNPEEYIRRDIEGSDVDTRRRAACDLVKVLSLHFEAKMMEIFGQYIQLMLQTYVEKPQENWRSKDAAVYMVTSLASRGQTKKHGITQISQLVNLEEFATKHVLPELQREDVNSLPVLKADALKYVMIFRNILPQEMVVQTIPQLARHLLATSQVVHTYAACAIDKILLMNVVKAEDLSQISREVIINLFAAMEKPGSQENEYLMKAVMRMFSVLQDVGAAFLGEVLPKVIEKMKRVASNPTKPYFNHYLFETLSLSIRILCKNNPATVKTFEETLFPIFEAFLQQDVQEFIPYVFQILSLLMEVQSSGSISNYYMMLYPFLLSPLLWERPGNVKPLVRLLQAYVRLGSEQIISVHKVTSILGVFQKLIASKLNDHEGFNLIQTILEHFPPASLEPFMKQIFVVLFQRLSSTKTSKFVKCLITFFSYYIVRYGASSLVSTIDGIQPNMFEMVIQRVIMPDLQRVSGAADKKVTAVGITELLCKCPEVVDGPYQASWMPLLSALLEFFELPECHSPILEDLVNQSDETDGGYQPVYSQLVYATKKEHDPVPHVSDARLYLAQSLGKLASLHPGRFVPALSSGLPPEKNQCLSKYLAQAGVTLA
ncbi:exportin-2 [Bacillus rossius redtenbacheri]|uniref:exportin-2 n=1 Tax=Bacillus rossius redtenbacheri TaxID=93214 RepID=UPI002FDD9049